MSETQITTLGELGANCPISMPNGAKPDFSFKPWRMREEKEIGQLKSRKKTTGVFVREVFDYMLTSFDGRDWGSYSASERKLLLNQQPIGNMFYMYFYLRYDALGEELAMQAMTCPECSAKVEGYTADLTSLEVKIEAENGGKREPNKIELRKPILIGDSQVDTILTSYTPWDCMEKVKATSANDGAIKEAFISSSIVGFESKEMGRLDNLAKNLVLNQLPKREIENIYTSLDDQNGGPIMKMAVACNSCGHEWESALNWSYDYFFGNSSLPSS